MAASSDGIELLVQQLQNKGNDRRRNLIRRWCLERLHEPLVIAEHFLLLIDHSFWQTITQNSQDILKRAFALYLPSPMELLRNAVLERNRVRLHQLLTTYPIQTTPVEKGQLFLLAVKSIVENTQDSTALMLRLLQEEAIDLLTTDPVTQDKALLLLVEKDVPNDVLYRYLNKLSKEQANGLLIEPIANIGNNNQSINVIAYMLRHKKFGHLKVILAFISDLSVQKSLTATFLQDNSVDMLASMLSLPNWLTKEDKEAFLIAEVKKGDLATVNIFLNNGVDIETKDTIFGKTLLYIAAEYRHKEIVTALVARGASILVTTLYGYTPLMAAAIAGDDEIIEFLVQSLKQQKVNPLQISAYINGRQRHNKTALTLAAEYGHVECMRLLLDAGAIIDMLDLESAVNNGRIEALNLLIARGLDPAQHPDPNKLIGDALYLADNYVVLNRLLPYVRNNLDKNTPFSNGGTLLSRAALSGSVECVKILLAEGCDPSAPTGIIHYDTYNFVSGMKQFNNRPGLEECLHLMWLNMQSRRAGNAKPAGNRGNVQAETSTIAPVTLDAMEFGDRELRLSLIDDAMPPINLGVPAVSSAEPSLAAQNGIVAMEATPAAVVVQATTNVAISAPANAASVTSMVTALNNQSSRGLPIGTKQEANMDMLAANAGASLADNVSGGAQQLSNAASSALAQELADMEIIAANSRKRGNDDVSSGAASSGLSSESAVTAAGTSETVIFSGRGKRIKTNGSTSSASANNAKPRQQRK